MPLAGDVKFQKYITVLFDILNQREHLAKLARLPESMEEQSEFTSAARKSIGTVNDLRDGFLKYYDSYHDRERSNFDHPFPNDSSKELFNNLTLYQKPKFQFFSDTILVYTPVFSDNGEPFLSSVLGTILSSATMMLVSLAEGVPVRGGIDIGIGTECFGEEIYGPVLSSVHWLESEVAQYPRIVVGSGLREYLDMILSTSRSNNTSELWRKRGNFIINIGDFIARDIDGVYFIDFMSPTSLDLILQKETLSKSIDQAREFVASSYEGFVKNGDRKLALRYGWLREYMNNRYAQYRKSRL